MYSRIWSGEINWILKTDFQLKFWDESLSDDFIIVFSPKTLQDPQTLNASQDLSKVPYINMMMSSELGKDLSTWPGQLSVGITSPCKTPCSLGECLQGSLRSIYDLCVLSIQL